MEKEISNGAMLGIVLIALAAIIGLGFGVFSIAKNTANEGVTGVQENLGAVGNAAFTDYDQKIVTGTQVNSAYNNFQGKPYAILIATQATKDKSATTGASTGNILQGAGIDAAYTNSGNYVPLVFAYKDSSLGGVFDSKTSNGTNIQLTSFNYNALLKHTLAGTTSSSSKIYFDGNCWRATQGFEAVSGKIIINGITGNIAKSGMMEYVPSGARFQAYLIKDQSGTIMGVAFEQLNSN